MLSMLPNPAMHDLRAMFRNWALSALTFLGRSLKRRWRMWLVTEAAYRRGDLFEKRRRLMDAWAAHCQILSRVVTH